VAGGQPVIPRGVRSVGPGESHAFCELGQGHVNDAETRRWPGVFKK